MSKPLQATTVAAVGQNLAIAWDGGGESFLPFENLRRACPCATCGGEPDVLGWVQRPEVDFGPRSFELVGWEFVGGYALQPVWADGHRTGIFSWPYLQKLADQTGAE